MKGLLLKDFYMIWKYCKSFLLIIAVFMVLSFSGGDNVFFVFYPSILISTLPVTIIAYDERAKWNIYSEALPISRAQVVSSKYIMLLIGIALTGLANAFFQALRMVKDGTFNANDYISLMALLVAASMLAPSVMLPFVFKLGSEKGRIIYLAVIGISSAFVGVSSLGKTSFALPNISIAIVSLCCVAIFVLSWLLSIKLYKSREL